MPERRVRLAAEHMAVGEDVRFCVWRLPWEGAVRGTVVHAPAFAEEMNKSRHVVAAGARALAAEGYAVVQVDPLGCGDSPGDFGDATFGRWVDDVAAVARAAHARHGGVLWLWGLRAGCLLATAALSALAPTPASLLLWQPVVSGRQHLAQFLRLASTGSALASGGGERTGAKDLRERLARGETVEVAGYRIAPGLAAGLDAATLAVPPGFPGRVVWLEVGPAPATLSPASSQTLARLLPLRVEASALEGPGFWQATELEDAPALVDATRAALALHAHVEPARTPAVL